MFARFVCQFVCFFLHKFNFLGEVSVYLHQYLPNAPSKNMNKEFKWNLKEVINHLTDSKFRLLRPSHQIKNWHCHILKFFPVWSFAQPLSRSATIIGTYVRILTCRVTPSNPNGIFPCDDLADFIVQQKKIRIVISTDLDRTPSPLVLYCFLCFFLFFFVFFCFFVLFWFFRFLDLDRTPSPLVS